MAVHARYTESLQVPVEPEMRDRIRAIADREGVSLAQVAREILSAGIQAREEGPAR
jgi:plasmid stability protein